MDEIGMNDMWSGETFLVSALYHYPSCVVAVGPLRRMLCNFSKAIQNCHVMSITLCICYGPDVAALNPTFNSYFVMLLLIDHS